MFDDLDRIALEWLEQGDNRDMCALRAYVREMIRVRDVQVTEARLKVQEVEAELAEEKKEVAYLQKGFEQEQEITASVAKQRDAALAELAALKAQPPAVQAKHVITVGRGVGVDPDIYTARLRWPYGFLGRTKRDAIGHLIEKNAAELGFVIKQEG
jgi:hypothetical protein